MNKTLLLVLAVIGSGSALLCCGCGGFVGIVAGIYSAEGADVRDELLTNPVLKEHVGEIRQLEFNLRRSLFTVEEHYYFRVEGSKASGTITVADATDIDLENLDATLRLDSGEKIRLTPPFGDEPHVELETEPDAEPKAEREPKVEQEVEL